jgi:hypothetical protein
VADAGCSLRVERALTVHGPILLIKTWAHSIRSTQYYCPTGHGRAKHCTTERIQGNPTGSRLRAATTQGATPPAGWSLCGSRHQPT